MKNLLFFLTCFLSLLSFSSFSSDNQIKELKYLCKTWGYLKYYHPNMNDKNLDWDTVLVKEIDQYLKGESSFENSIHSFFDIAGDYELSEEVLDTNGNVVKLVDFDWMKDPLLPPDISKKLCDLEKHYQFRKNKYGYLSRYYFVLFLNEEAFNYREIPVECRLFELFRYWNKIEYYCPNKHLLIEEWDVILEYYIDKLLKARDIFEVSKLFLGLSFSLNDSHAHLYTYNSFKNKSIGNYRLYINLEIKNKRVFIGHIHRNYSFEEGNLKVGDEILNCHKGTIDSIYKKVKQYAPFSNPKYIDQLVREEIIRSVIRSFNYEILRKGDTISVKLRGRKYEVLSKDTEPYLIEPGISYYRVVSFPGGIEYFPKGYDMFGIKKKKIFATLFQTDTIILDLRDYVPYAFKYHFAKHLFDKSYCYDHLNPKKRVTKPGYFLREKHQKFGGRKKRFEGLLVLLVNDETHSESEFTALILQKYKNSITVGVPTSGTAGYTSKIKLMGSVGSQITLTNTILENGQLYDHSGIKIDYEVDYTKQNEIEWKDDYILESAIHYIRHLKMNN